MNHCIVESRAERVKESDGRDVYGLKSVHRTREHLLKMDSKNNGGLYVRCRAYARATYNAAPLSHIEIHVSSGPDGPLCAMKSISTFQIMLAPATSRTRASGAANLKVNAMKGSQNAVHVE